MNAHRIDRGRQRDTARPDREIEFFVNGRPTRAYQGETLHAALIAAGYLQLRRSKGDRLRGVFCGMGVCYECLVTINCRETRQACMTLVEAGMEVGIDVP